MCPIKSAHISKNNFHNLQKDNNMENKTLTPQQIEHLHEFCEFHNVKYYDVQIELVDHLASAIEKHWETEPQLTFEEALVDVAEQFGVDPFHFSRPDSLLPFPIENIHANSGFDAITEARAKTLERKYNRLHIRYFFEFFKLPKLVLTIASTLIIYGLFEFVRNKALAAGIYLPRRIKNDFFSEFSQFCVD